MGVKLPDMQTLTSVEAFGVPVKDPVYEEIKGNQKCVEKDLTNQFLINLRIQDETEFIHRYKWINTPPGFDQELIERMLYYRGQVGFFYDEIADKFMILPCVLTGGIDEVGRYKEVQFLPFNGSSEIEKSKNGKTRVYLPAEGKKPIWDVQLEEDVNLQLFDNACVILSDYCRQISQKIIPRYILQDEVMQFESEIYPLVRTGLIASAGNRLLRLSNGNQGTSIQILNQTLYKNALNGNVYLGFTGEPTTQDITNADPFKVEEYLTTLQSLENKRLAQMGIKNGGIFQKKAQELQSENDMITKNSSKVYNDGLLNRQKFCNIINSIWADPEDPTTFMWCLPDETEINMDLDGDGMIDSGDNLNESQTMNVGGNNNESIQ